MEKLKPTFFEKHEVEHQIISKLKKIVPFKLCQVSDAHAENEFQDFPKRMVLLNRMLSIGTSMEK